MSRIGEKRIEDRIRANPCNPWFNSEAVGFSSPRTLRAFPWLVWLALCVSLAACSRPVVEAPPTKEEIWAAIQPQAARYRFDPVLIYALVAAESDFDPRARNGEARGLLQLKPAAWAQVSAAPYEPTVWSWRANLEAGIDYLAFTRSALQRRSEGAFSDALLLAAFHHGLEYVEARGFEVGRLECPDHPIYRELWAGRLPSIPLPR